MIGEHLREVIHPGRRHPSSSLKGLEFMFWHWLRTWWNRRTAFARREGRSGTPCPLFQPLVEPLEERQLLSPILVTNANNAGPGSLRQAILTADSTMGPNTITFQVKPGGVLRIAPIAPLPILNQTVVIDGTQPGRAGKPIVVLDGTKAGSSANGLTINASGCTVKGLVIEHFRGAGIKVTGNGNVIQGNEVGTNSGGTVAPNFGIGVVVRGALNLIGGVTAGARNVISGNAVGVFLTDRGTLHNTVEGNFIGTNVAGTAPLENLIGLEISNRASSNVIGGVVARARNVISGNGGTGIDIADSGTTGNVVEGNFIGTDVSGTHPLINKSVGVGIDRASGNRVGGTTAAARNVISGNGTAGVFLYAGSTGNLVEGNFIGTDVTGTRALIPLGIFPGVGVEIALGASDNTIGGILAGARHIITARPGNVISGNSVAVMMAGSGNLVEGNFIGTNAAGTHALANIGGIALIPGASRNTLGGTTGAGNVISGNVSYGISITDVGDSNNLVQGNFIGTDVTGTVTIVNGGTGVELVSGTNGNTIGGTTAGAGNLISGNLGGGVLLGSSTFFNRVEGNLIGTDVTGTRALGNALFGVGILNGTANTVGGTGPGAGNFSPMRFSAI
jgi:large repetitive protein